jgi:hypothetical protein
MLGTATGAVASVEGATMMQEDRSHDVLARLLGWERHAEEVGRETVEARLDAWQARIDALRVRAHLGQLDLTDGITPVVDRLDQRLDGARARMRALALEARDVWTALDEAYASARDELAAGEQLARERVEA